MSVQYPGEGIPRRGPAIDQGGPLVGPSQRPSWRTPSAPLAAIEASSARGSKASEDEGLERLSSSQRRFVDQLKGQLGEVTRGSIAVAAQAGSVLCDSRRAFVARHAALNSLHYPICARASAGPFFREVGGRDYLDLAMGFGCHLFGHNPTFLVDALKRQAGRSLAAGVGTEHDDDVRTLFNRLTQLTLVDLRPSGTEAIMSAIRLARAATGRRKVVVFSNAYHGHADLTLVTPDTSGGSWGAAPMSSGTPASLVQDTVVLPFGDASSLDLIRRNAGELAAVLVEAVQNRRPDYHPVDFLKALRLATQNADVPLVFDEILLGFRVHPSGAHGLFGLSADLATYGKILGGGVPVAAVGASSAFAERLARKDGAHALPSDPGENGAFVMAAVRAMLSELAHRGPQLQDELNTRTDGLIAALNRDFAELGVPLGARNFGSFFRFCQNGNFSFVHTPVEFELFLKGLVAEGIYVIEGATCFLSTAHGEGELSRIRATVRAVVERMLAAGFWHATTNRVASKVEAGSTAPRAARAERSPIDSVVHLEQVKPPGVIRGAFAHGLDLGISFFGNYDKSAGPDAYARLLETARHADALGFSTLWLPERHFHEFGGFSPNPSVLAAAIAVATKRIKIRAGSVILPLHHPLRVVEEWGVVDNLSEGRVGLTFASGWQANDFVLAPGGFAHRKDRMFEAIEAVQRLWKGDSTRYRNDLGENFDLVTYPRPVQAELPIWIASLGSVESFERAGALGFGVLTNLISQDTAGLADKIAAYRAARERHGLDPRGGKVAVLVHTLVGTDLKRTREAARWPLYEYLTSAVDLRGKMFAGEKKADFSALSQEDREYILSKAFDRYAGSNALIGTPASCAPILQSLAAAGATEVACFLDFGVRSDVIDAGLPVLAELLRAEEPAKDAVAALGRAQERAQDPLVVDTAPASGKAETLRPKARVSAASPDQTQLFALNELGGHSARAYHVRSVLEIHGALNLKALENAWQMIAARHETLRTVFADHGQTLRVQGEAPVPLHAFDLSTLTPEQRAEAARLLLEEEARQAFELTARPGYRVTVLRFAAEEHVMVLTVHHALFDAAATNTLLVELDSLYQASLEGRDSKLAPALQFVDFLGERQERLGNGRLSAHETYFRKVFPDGVPLLDLPADLPRPRSRSYRGRQFIGAVSSERFQRLKNAARRARCTPFTLVLTAYGVLLRRWTRQTSVVVGTSIRPGWSAGRNLVGWSTNLVPMRLEVTDELTVDELVRQVRGCFLDAVDHEDVPYASFLKWFDIAKSSGAAPLIATTLNWDKVEVPSLGGLDVTAGVAPLDSTRFDLAVDVNELPDGLRLYWDFNSDLFLQRTVEALHQSLLSLLDGLTDALEGAASSPVAALRLTSTVPSFTKPMDEGPPSLLELFLRSVERHPDEMAVADGSVSLTFAELHRAAISVRSRLAEVGVGASDRVVVHLPSGANLMAALLACWSLGAAFVPLDVGQPVAWKTQQVRTLGARALLTTSSAEPMELEAATTLDMDAPAPRNGAEALSLPAGDPPAYVVFTSGSTGRAKAVVIHQSSAAHYARAVCSRLDLQRGVFLCASPPQVDLGYTMWFAALATGGMLVLAPTAGADRIQRLLQLSQSYPADYLKLTPSYFDALSTHPDVRALLPRRKLILGGERLRWDIPAKVRECAPGLAVANHYGPTETTVGVAAGDVPVAPGDSASVPVGEALDGVSLFVVDPTLNVLPPGLAGELCVAGPCLAAGYFNDEARTNEAFVTPSVGALAGTRLYRTGDRARRSADGRFEILGRLDRQLKVHGFRVEPASIEAVLVEHPAVARVVVSATADAETLVAYYTTTDGHPEPAAEQLREVLRSRLPAALVPSAFVRVDAFALGASGKIDMSALPDASVARAATPRGPLSEPQTLMLEIWRDVLQKPELGVDDDFFDVGGHSLHIVRLNVRIKRAFNVELGLDTIFEHSTPAALVLALNLNNPTLHDPTLSAATG